MFVASPVFFDGLAGMFHAAEGSTAILMLSPWAYEELCSRKAFRTMADQFAENGYPCLRFDFPGTCHSAIASDAIDDPFAWRNAAEAALDQLIELCAPSRVILLGQGIGGLIAGDLARKRDVAGIIYLGAVSQGRTHLREISAWTAMTKPTFLVGASDGPEGGIMAGGFVLSASTASEIKGLSLLKGDAPMVSRSLVVERPENPADVRFAEHLISSGASVDRIPFHGYVDYISNPTLSRLPEQTVGSMLSWVKTHFPSNSSPSERSQSFPSKVEVQGEGFQETFCRFGPGAMFFGVLSEPVESQARTGLIVLNAGYDHSCGWGRYTVDLAREMATDGFAVLRMDMAGIGETPLWPGQQEQVLYSERQNDDVKCAVDWMKAERCYENIIIIGRCSGAYQAFVSAELDMRIDGAFLINARRLVWDPDEDVDEAIREPIQTLSTYRNKIASPRQLKRLLSGELPISRAIKRLAQALGKVADQKLAPVLRNFSKHHRLDRILHARLEALRARGAPVELVYSDGDRGLLEVSSWFGPGTAGLSNYPNVNLSSVPNADHNLSPLPARVEVTAKLLEFARRLERR
ncbi:alpha/beta fold hydrolase [Roseibium polysiphoniae]|uniref:Alpha/beta fold hydrolase n=1 Tax=Roseibium polysiphoniae TaxID=2571221 RepID=A0ABR9CGW6_9HYPH|nr:alpha/beta fold hydrolase [Roseibium polysiphoniae]MBD8878420.1 alpha/beta fold hydrolase [Roseibium polysiphoniae]